MSTDTDVDRTDAASTGVGFKSWLEDVQSEDVDAVGEFAPLYFITSDSRFPLDYSFHEYTSTMPDVCANDDDAVALVELLLVAEGAWRADRLAKTRARGALGLVSSTGEGITGMPSRGRRTKASAAVLRCSHAKRDGSLCGRPTVPGTIRCQDHGGAIIDPEVRRSILMSAYATLVEGADVAVAALIDVARSSRNDLARVTAAKEILDRVGIGAEQTITLKVVDDSGPDKLDQARDKLIDMRDRLLADPHAAIDVAVTDADSLEERDPSEPIIGELVT